MAENTITFKLIPNMNKPLIRESRVRLRALYDYDPVEDKYIPCKEAGLAFTRGDILHIVSQDDPYWWVLCSNTFSPFHLFSWQFFPLFISGGRRVGNKIAIWELALFQVGPCRSGGLFTNGTSRMEKLLINKKVRFCGLDIEGMKVKLG